jgi:hypothetical protein
MLRSPQTSRRLLPPRAAPLLALLPLLAPAGCGGGGGGNGNGNPQPPVQAPPVSASAFVATTDFSCGS